MPIESIEHGARQLLGFGAEVEVLEPAELRTQVLQQAGRLLALYRGPERLRVNRSCPLITPKDARSSLQMLAIALAMAVLCASIGRLLTRGSATLEKLSASEPNGTTLSLQNHLEGLVLLVPQFGARDVA